MPQPVTLSYDPFRVARGGRVLISAKEQHAAEAGSRAICAKDWPAFGGPLKIRAPSTVKRWRNRSPTPVVSVATHDTLEGNQPPLELQVHFKSNH